MTLAIAKWTVEDYHHIIATGILDNRNVELIHGEIIEMAPEGEPHAYYSSEAGDYLTRLLGDRALVRQAKPITLPDDSEPEPDLAIVQRLGRQYLRHHPYPENIFWVVEYSQASLTKDKTIKHQLYAAVGIPEYWLVDLAQRQLVVWRQPRAGEYMEQQVLSSGVICPVAFPDLRVAVAQIIAP